MLKLFYICKIGMVKTHQKGLKDTEPLNLKKFVLFTCIQRL